MTNRCVTLCGGRRKVSCRLDPWPPVPTFVASSEPVPRGRPGESVREAPESSPGLSCVRGPSGPSGVGTGGAVAAPALEAAEEHRVVEVDVPERGTEQLERVAGQRVGV